MLEQLIHSVESGLKDLGRRLLQPERRANNCSMRSIGSAPSCTIAAPS